MNKITFVFQSGRLSRLKRDDGIYSKEFFYSFLNFREQYDNIEIIEFLDNKNLFSYITRPIYRFLRYVSTIPFYCEKIVSVKNLKTFFNSDYIIFTNQRVAFSSLPLVLILSIFKKKNYTVFIMGLFVNQSNNFIRVFLRKIFTILLLNICSNIIFLSKSEKDVASSYFPKLKNKYYFLPFPVDLDFWNTDHLILTKKEYILFIGNDGKRDYKLMVDIANKMPDYKFIFVSKNFNSFKIPKNVELIEGKWDENVFSDKDIRDIYGKSLISLIPLKESFQPSGQSVALQSMSMKVPVLISDTSGFWDKTKFSNFKNIVFIKINKASHWVENIEKLISDKNIYEEIRDSAHSVILENYNLDKFYDDFKKILF